MAANRSANDLTEICSHPISRQLVDRPRGLTKIQMDVLVAACNEAIRSGAPHLTASQVADRLHWMDNPFKSVVQSLNKLSSLDYVHSDDGPENTEIVLHVTTVGFEEFAKRHIHQYKEISTKAMTLVAQWGEGCSSSQVASTCGIQPFLAEHILVMAAGSRLIVLDKREHYVIISKVLPELRRMFLGVA